MCQAVISRKGLLARLISVIPVETDSSFQFAALVLAPKARYKRVQKVIDVSYRERKIKEYKKQRHFGRIPLFYRGKGSGLFTKKQNVMEKVHPLPLGLPFLARKLGTNGNDRKCRTCL